MLVPEVTDLLHVQLLGSGLLVELSNSLKKHFFKNLGDTKHIRDNWLEVGCSHIRASSETLA